jgi:predicted phosphodiesterase
MRRTNGTQLRVDAPSKGLITRLPSDLQDDGKAQFLTVAENVRAEKGELQAAPGYERVHFPEKQLDGEVNLIHQPNLTSSDVEVERLPIVGTDGQLWTMKKRARNLVCPAECSVRFAAVADSGTVGANTLGVAKQVQSWDPDLVIHAGDLVYPDGGTAVDDDKYETQVARGYYWAIGGYSGPYGTGPAVNKFLPALGNHDYDDGPASRYFTFFKLPGNERYYTVKRGPVQFFFIDSYGYGPSAPGPGGVTVAGTGADPGVGSADVSSTGPQAQWLQQQLAESDCPWRVVIWHHPPQTSGVDYYPGYSVMNWPLGTWGADVLITGHSHLYERIHRADGVLHIITGWSGKDLRDFVTTPVTGSMARYNTDYGAVRFDVTTKTLTAKAITQSGIEIDTVTRTTTRDLQVCYTGPATNQAAQLEVIPETATIPQGVAFPFRAVAHFTNGSTSDVTTLAAWSSSATGVATVDSAGVVTGYAAGVATIQAEYQGMIDTAAVVVLSDCLDMPYDIALLIDKSGSMAYGAPPTGNRMDRLKVASGLFLDSLYSGDQVATFSFSNDPQLHHTFTADLSVARAAINGLAPEAATNVADTVDAAVVELTTKGRPNAGKLLILFTDGIANMSRTAGCNAQGFDVWCGMTAATGAFTAAKAAGIKCIVVSLDLNTYPQTFEDVVITWPTCPTVYFPVIDADNLPATFVRLRNEVCVGLCSSGSGVGILLL